MTAKELIQGLSKLHPDTKLFLQIDPEGNGYNEVAGCEAAAFCERDGELSVYSLDYSADDCCLEEKEWKKIKRENKCAVIWPS